MVIISNVPWLSSIVQIYCETHNVHLHKFNHLKSRHSQISFRHREADLVGNWLDFNDVVHTAQGHHISLHNFYEMKVKDLLLNAASTNFFCNFVQSIVYPTRSWWISGKKYIQHLLWFELLNAIRWIILSANLTQ